eukprot:scaffold26863_cov59-Attheya_sp.AAC.1
MSWRRRPALVVRECDTAVGGTYWDRDLLQAWSALDHHSSSSCGDILTISYSALLRLASPVTALLLHAILEHIAQHEETHEQENQQDNEQEKQENQQEKQQQVVVAVAIPEGPLLPLAILAVHALTLDALHIHTPVDTGIALHNTAKSSLGLDNRVIHVVLLPMEPEEPKHRLRHILYNARPSLLLALPGPDTLRLQSILNDIRMDDDQDRMTQTNTRIVDFRELTRMGLQQCQDHPPNNNANNNPNDMDSASSSCLIPRLVMEGAHSILRTTRTSSCHDGWTIIRNDTMTTKQPQPRTNKMSHVVYTSGTTGIPKGCVSSVASLEAYLVAKRKSHFLSSSSIVLLASAVSFDPCFSDILATWNGVIGAAAGATLALVPRAVLFAGNALLPALDTLRVTHILTTPTLWSLQENHIHKDDDGKVSLILSALQVIALGGEPIPRHLVHRWARHKQPTHHNIPIGADTVDNDAHDADRNAGGAFHPGKIKTRLLCTYGVTEACVYQTCGEVFHTTSSSNSVTQNGSHRGGPLNINNNTLMGGQDVGMPMEGMQVRICVESSSSSSSSSSSTSLTDDLVNSDEPRLKDVPVSQNGHEVAVGEVVLVGNQLDEFSSYLNRPDLTRQAFIPQNENENDIHPDPQQDGDHRRCHRRYHYRTGDRGYIHRETGHLYILGRIGGDGMVKINGVRIELGEIESSIIDNPAHNSTTSTSHNQYMCAVVKDCLAMVTESVQDRGAPDLDSNVRKHIIAYCVLENTCLLELGLTTALSSTLQWSDGNNAKGLICSTGPLLTLLRERCTTRVRKGCVPSTFVIIPQIPLSPTGKRNRKALPGLSECQSISQNMDCSTDSSGSNRNRVLWEYGGAGELLANQLVIHLNLQPCQIKAGLTTSATFGTLGGDSLAATRVVRALYSEEDSMPSSSLSNLEEGARLHDAVLEAITFGQTDIALALLDMGASPNNRGADDKNNRLSKVRHRMDRRQKFKSSPLHLACIGGNVRLVKGLLAAGSKFNTPDATGSFPIHIACSGLGQGLGTLQKEEEPTTDDIQRSVSERNRDNDTRRTECVQHLLDAGAPLAMKDGNKQTLFHCAARSGNCPLIRFLMQRLDPATNNDVSRHGWLFNWHDRWFRTPVHWAILNGHVEALKVLLDSGCNPNPNMPKASRSNRHTSADIETPLELCLRLYGNKEGTMGSDIVNLLKQRK